MAKRTSKGVTERLFALASTDAIRLFNAADLARAGQLSWPAVETSRAPLLQDEALAWTQWHSGELEDSALAARLSEMRSAGTALSEEGLGVVALRLYPADLGLYLSGHRDSPPQAQPQRVTTADAVTCACVLTEAGGSVSTALAGGPASCLVVGTRGGRVHVWDAACVSISQTYALPAGVAHIACSGILDGDYTVRVACADGCVYGVRCGALLQARVEAGAPIVGIGLCGDGEAAELVVATWDRTLAGYDLHGSRNWTARVPAPVTAVCGLPGVGVVAVALEGGELRLYRGQRVLAKTQLPATVTAVHCAPPDPAGVDAVPSANAMGKGKQRQRPHQPQQLGDACTLVAALRFGAVAFVNVGPLTDESERSHLELEQSEAEAYPPLPIPPVPSPLRDEANAAREAGSAQAMYRRFQDDLAMLRLTAARTYLTVRRPLNSYAAMSVRLPLMSPRPRTRPFMQDHTSICTSRLF